MSNSSRVLSRTLVDWCYLPLPPAPALLRVVDLRFPPRSPSIAAFDFSVSTKRQASIPCGFKPVLAA